MRGIARPALLTSVVSLVLLLLLLLSLTFIPHVSAAGVVGDGTPGSCTRVALEERVIGGGVVTFNCGSSPHVIILDSPLSIVNEVIINGGNLISLSGGNAQRIFVVGGAGKLTLRNIILSNGYAPDGGGAIFNSGPLILENVVIRNSKTTGSGGAIQSSNAPMTATNTIFEHNSAVNGGALYPRFAGARYNLVNVTLRHNEALYSGGDTGWGGAILLWDGAHVEFSGGSASDNVAYRGGAVYLSHANSSIFVNGTAFSKNVAAQSGGAIFSQNGTTTVEGATFAENCACANTVDSGQGGAITQRGGNLYIYASTFTKNLAQGGAQGAYGGAIYMHEGDLILERSTLLSNEAHSSNVARGGALSAYAYKESGPADVWIHRSTFQFNIADTEGGAIYLRESSPATIYGSTFGGNASYSDGGAILARPGTRPVLTNVSFSGNEANRYGGALFLGSLTSIPFYGKAPEKVTMLGVTIDENIAYASSGGGGIYLADTTPLEFTNVVLSRNTDGDDAASNCSPALPSTGIAYSLSSDDTCALQGVTNHNDEDAMLGGLLNNGGSVLTIHPQVGSPLIDAGICPSGFNEDARGVSRPQGAACDIGAVEVAPTPIATATPTNTPTRTPAPTATFTPTPTRQGPTPTHTSTPTAIPTLRPPDDTVTINPDSETSYTFEATTGQVIDVFVPEGAVDAPIELEFRSLEEAPPPDLNFVPGGPVFRIDARQDGELQSDFVFNEAITLDISYLDTDVDSLDKDAFELYFHQHGRWQNDGIELIDNDVDDMRASFYVLHLTLFALGNPTEPLYLPSIRK